MTQNGSFGNGSWSFSNYGSTYSFTELASDQVNSNSAAMTVTGQIVIAGSGANGTKTESGLGTYTYNNAKRWYGPYSVETSVSLQGPQLPFYWAELGMTPASSWKGGAVALAVLQAVKNGPQLPILTGIGPIGNWVSVQGANVSGPWAWVGQFQAVVWNAVNRAYLDGFERSSSGQKALDPLALAASRAWQRRIAMLPADAPRGQDGWASWQDFTNFIGGVVDTVTFGLTRYLRNWAGSLLDYIGLGSLREGFGLNVDESSMAYRLGGYVGQAINIALTFVPGGGALMWAIRGAQAFGGAIGGVEAAANGDYLGAGLSLVGGLAGGVRGLSSCGAQSVVRGLFGNATARMATRAAGAAGLATRGLAVAGVGMGVGSAINRFASGDYVGALLDLGQAGASAFQASRACFTAEMLLDAEEGKKRADAIKVGDFLWSRSEYDPYGPIELKEVEEVFTRVSPILNVHVAGQIIRTTPEHPFRVFLKGWVPAAMLEIGDLLMTRGGLLVPVEGVADSGQVETVYNWRIAEHHTYFVSANEQGVSVWAHNAYQVQSGNPPNPGRFSGRTTEILSWESNGQTRWVRLQSGERNAANAGLNRPPLGTDSRNYHHVESQAIQVMNRQGISNARLVINHPNGVCGICSPRP